MITIFVRCSDGREGDWTFDTVAEARRTGRPAPSGSGRTLSRCRQELNIFRVRSDDIEEGKGVGVALRLLQIDAGDPIPSGAGTR